MKLKFTKLGLVGGTILKFKDLFEITVKEISDIYYNTIPAIMSGDEKFKRKIQRLSIFKYFRKLRFLYHRRPHWQKTYKFFKHYLGGLYDRIDRHNVFCFQAD